MLDTAKRYLCQTGKTLKEFVPHSRWQALAAILVTGEESDRFEGRCMLETQLLDHPNIEESPRRIPVQTHLQPLSETMYAQDLRGRPDEAYV